MGVHKSRSLEEEIDMETSLEESPQNSEKRDLGAREEARMEGRVGANLETS